MGLIKFNFSNLFLLIAFIALPIAGLLLHLKLHSDITYLTWILWFDIVIISLLYLFNKTRFIGFILNSVFFVVGVIMHLIYIGGGGISDILIAIPDFSIGYVLWISNRITPVEQEKPVQQKPVEQKKIPEQELIKQKPVEQKEVNQEKIKPEKKVEEAKTKSAKKSK